MVKTGDGETATEHVFSDDSDDNTPTKEIRWKPVHNTLKVDMHDLKHSLAEKQVKRKKYLCMVCNEKFPNKGNLKRHNENQHKETPVEQYGNGHESGNDTDKEQDADSDITCSYEQADNETKKTKHEHSSINGAEESKHNPLDDVQESEKGVKHIKRRGKYEPNRRFPCEVCGRIFLYRSKYVTHLAKHSSDKPYLCTGCGTFFKTKSGMDRHMRSICFKTGESTSEKRNPSKLEYPCSECEKCFWKKSDLESHFRKHSGEQPFLCVYCGARYKRNATLKEHVAMHHENGPPRSSLKPKLSWKKRNAPKVSCNECGKLFHYTSELTTHMRKHTGQCPYQCPKCGFYFKRHSYLVKSHMKTCTGKGKRSYRDIKPILR